MSSTSNSCVAVDKICVRQKKIKTLIEKYRKGANIGRKVSWDWTLIIAEAFNGKQLHRQYNAVETIRKLVSLRCHETVNVLIDINMLGALVDILRTSNSSRLLRQATWALSDVVNLHVGKGMKLVEARAVPRLINMIQISHLNIGQYAMSALGKIVVESVQCRDVVVSHGYIRMVAKLVKKNPPIKMMLKISKSLLITYGHSPNNVVGDSVSDALEVLQHLIHVDNTTVQADTLCAIKYLFINYTSHCIRFLDISGVHWVVQMLEHKVNSIQVAAIMCMQHILLTVPEKLVCLLSYFVLSKCHNLLNVQSQKLRCETLKLITLIAGCRGQPAAILKAGLVTIIFNTFECDNMIIKKEAIWVFRSLLDNAQPEDVLTLARGGLILLTRELLGSKHGEVIYGALEILVQFLKKAKIYGSLIAYAFEEADVFSKVDRLVKRYPERQVIAFSTTLNRLMISLSKDIEM